MDDQLTPIEWQKAQQIFELIIEAPEQQEHLLNQHCQDNQNLYAAVKQLLAQDQDLHTFSTKHATETLAQLLQDHELVTDVGRYRLLKKLGEGGMGQVYLAERSDEEFYKQVVIKLIRSDFITDKYSTTQFRKERQTLANLEHPNIAQLLDGGTLENGTPYVVMQYVEGEPITTFCQSHNLTTTARIQLFVKLCHALAYAHQKMVIHRDIKPANILIKANGEPQLLDFGIAQSVEITAQTLDSITSNSGTPGYASPEQLQGQPQFASSDVYSLGVLLYELIFDERPFVVADHKNLLVSMQQDINFNQAWSQLKDKPLPKSLRRKELQAILSKSLSFDNQHRYQSCQSLIQDLQKLLSLHPLSVHSSSNTYRLQKFSQRHRLPVFLGSILVVAFLAFSTSLWIQSQRLKAQRDYAVSQQNKAQALSDILLSAYQDADPTHTRGDKVSAREILDQSLRHIDQNLNQQEDVRIELKSTLSTVYTNLGLYDKAAEIAQQALDDSQNHGQIDQQTIMDIELNLAMILSQSGAQALATLKRVNPLLPALILGNADNADSNALRWKAMKLKAIALTQLSQTKEAIAIYRQILDEKRSLLDANAIPVIQSIYDLGYLSYYDGYNDNNEEVMQRAYDIISRSEQAPHDLKTKITNFLANIKIRQNKLAEAKGLFLLLYEQTEKIYGRDHPAMGSVINKIGEISYRLGDMQQSINYFQEYIDLTEKFYGPSHINVAFAKFNLANVYDSGTAEPEKAAILYQQAIDIGQKVYQTKHKNLGYFYKSLGELHLKQNQPQKAQPYLAQSLANYLYVNAPKGRDIAKVRLLMAQVFVQLRVNDQAKKYLALALPVLEKNYPENNTYVQQARTLQQELTE